MERKRSARTETRLREAALRVFADLGQAVLRIALERPAPAYGAQMTELCLEALATDRRRIAAAMRHELPSRRDLTLAPARAMR